MKLFGFLNFLEPLAVLLVQVILFVTVLGLDFGASFLVEPGPADFILDFLIYIVEKLNCPLSYALFGL